jgi:hypothetical protein
LHFGSNSAAGIATRRSDVNGLESGAAFLLQTPEPAAASFRQTRASDVRSVRGWHCDTR